MNIDQRSFAKHLFQPIFADAPHAEMKKPHSLLIVKEKRRKYNE
ncbi:hypothetical protein [uncultured Bacteroides sp.]|jgi:hypothetical protein|nr:hypothetical protein [uncultured Bacteroides sp.]